MKKLSYLVTVLVSCSAAVNVLKAQDLQELRQQMVEQDQKIWQLSEQLNQYQLAQDAGNQAIARHISDLASQPKEEEKTEFTLPDSLKWAEKIKISGDLRYRHETIDEERAVGKWKTGRNRQRIRARMGLTAQVTEEWEFGFRMATGGEDPVSTNQDLTDGFTSKNIRLDKAYLDWHPKSMAGLNVIGGKMGVPFYKVGENQVIWDGDLTPEGIAAAYTTSLNLVGWALPMLSSQELFINGGGFWVDEEQSDADPSLFGVQAGLKQNLEDGTHVLGGVSYFNYGNVQGHGTLHYLGKTAGNTFTAEDVYLNDYDVLELFGEAGFKAGEFPMTAYGNYVINAAAENSEDHAWIIGGTFNEAKNPGTWEMEYCYRDVKKDAVLGTFNDSDFIGGGTNGRGHLVGFKYALAKNVSAGVSYFINEKGDENLKYHRLHVEMAVKF